MRKILIIGAGKTGRGFLPQYVKEDDHIIFLDRDVTLISQLQKAGAYQISFYGQERKARVITNYEAMVACEESYQSALLNCDMIAIAIGIDNYKDLAETLKPHLLKLKEKVIVTFENGIDAASRLQKMLQEEQLKITEGSIFCTTNTENEIDILSQELCYLPLKDQYLEGVFFQHITPIADFHSFMERKLYTYNLLSALFAYPGYIAGYHWLYEAANDSSIHQAAMQLMSLFDPILAQYFHITIQEQRMFSKAAIEKFANPFIQDDIARNCRDVKRKLESKERFMKPFTMMTEAKQDTTILLKTIAAALIYDKKEESGSGLALLKDTLLCKEERDKIAAYYEHLQENGDRERSVRR